MRRNAFSFTTPNVVSFHMKRSYQKNSIQDSQSHKWHRAAQSKLSHNSHSALLLLLLMMMMIHKADPIEMEQSREVFWRFALLIFYVASSPRWDGRVNDHGIDHLVVVALEFEWENVLLSCQLLCLLAAQSLQVKNVIKINLAALECKKREARDWDRSLNDVVDWLLSGFCCNCT